MNPKLINSIIAKKFDAWMASIEDATLRELLADNTICTGGAIASMIQGEKPNDFDFYFRTFNAANAAATYYVKQFLASHPKPQMGTGSECEVFVKVDGDLEQAGMLRVKIVVKSAGVASENGDDGTYQYFEGRPSSEAAEYVAKVMDEGKVDDAKDKDAKKPFTARFLSANAISLRDDVQAVIRFYGEPNEIHDNYDFVHATNYWTSWERKSTFNVPALLAIQNKTLVYMGSRYPLASLFRVRKFLDRGWTISAGQLLKIAVNLQKFDLLDVATLESQLTGVDVAYFNQLIDEVKKNGAEKVDATYLMELVNRMF